MYEFYVDGKTTYEPVTKNYFNGWLGSILCSVLKDNQEVQVCKVSGITEDIKEDIKNNPTNYLYKPMRITGMEFSTNQKNDELSIRHPKFIGFREDISYRDCTYDKLFG
jgi:ATP-dependent DNA ligase